MITGSNPIIFDAKHGVKNDTRHRIGNSTMGRLDVMSRIIFGRHVWQQKQIKLFTHNQFYKYRLSISWRRIYSVKRFEPVILCQIKPDDMAGAVFFFNLGYGVDELLHNFGIKSLKDSNDLWLSKTFLVIKKHFFSFFYIVVTIFCRVNSFWKKMRVWFQKHTNKQKNIYKHSHILS